jgi:hypothetical protein
MEGLNEQSCTMASILQSFNYSILAYWAKVVFQVGNQGKEK